MKTIVFHSAKGGVGRTLALYNMAMDLRKAGKNVVMLDWDYSAPGLSYKCCLPEGQVGYVEYLRDYEVEKRADQTSQECLLNKLNSLKKGIYKIQGDDDEKGHLWLIPAGDDNSQGYWDFISSYRFHRLFYFGTKEIGGLSKKTFPKHWLKLNEQAFNNDKCLIEHVVPLKPDYLLVDCKTSLETSAFAILLWADSVAHFLPPNKEGLKYLIDTARAIARHGDYPPRLTAVVSRLPYDPKGEKLKILQSELDKKINGDAKIKSVLSADNLISLSELQELEQNEAILNEKSHKNFRLWSLRHEYIDLYTHIDPNITNETREAANQKWCEILQVNRNERLYYKVFHHFPHLGTMENADDNRPNIAFRVATFHNLIDSIIDSILKSYGPRDILDKNRNEFRDAALKESGLFCGNDFAKHLKVKVFDGDPPRATVLQRLETWACFDSGVGFGHIELHNETFDERELSGNFIVTGDAFNSREDIDNGECWRGDLRNFFEGYLRGILLNVFDKEQFNIDIHDFDVKLVPANELPSTFTKKILNISVYKFIRTGKTNEQPITNSTE